MLNIRIDGEHNRLANNWGGIANQKKHAMEYGAAGAVLANGNFRLYYRNDGKIFQNTWKAADVRYTAYGRTSLTD